MAEQTTTTPTRQSQKTRTTKKKSGKPARKPWKVWSFRIYMLVCFAVAIGLGAIAWQFWIPEDVESYVQRLDNRPAISEEALSAANAQLANLGNVKVTQTGPIFYFNIEVSPEMEQQSAKDLAWESVRVFASSIANDGSEEMPFGKTFLSYEAQIVIQQTGNSISNEEVYKDPNTEESNVAYPLFGVVNDVHSQSINWTNN